MVYCIVFACFSGLVLAGGLLCCVCCLGCGYVGLLCRRVRFGVWLRDLVGFTPVVLLYCMMVLFGLVVLGCLLSVRLFVGCLGCFDCVVV